MLSAFWILLIPLAYLLLKWAVYSGVFFLLNYIYWVKKKVILWWMFRMIGWIIFIIMSMLLWWFLLQDTQLIGEDIFNHIVTFFSRLCLWSIFVIYLYKWVPKKMIYSGIVIALLINYIFDFWLHLIGIGSIDIFGFNFRIC